MSALKIRGLDLSRLPMWLVVSTPIAMYAIIFYGVYSYPGAVIHWSEALVTVLISIGCCFVGVGVYRLAIGRIRSLFTNSFPNAKNADSAGLRWLATFLSIETSVALCLYQYAPWLVAPSVAALGVALCLYFGHLLLFRVQCSLMELLAITTTFGLIGGLVISTPGALQLGLYLAPMIAAWVLYSAVSGIVNANLCGTNSIRARLLHMFYALWGNASPPLLCLGIAILIFKQTPRLGMEFYGAYVWPFVIVGAAGWFFNLWLGIKVRRIAKALLAPAPIALNAQAVDVK